METRYPTREPEQLPSAGVVRFTRLDFTIDTHRAFTSDEDQAQAVEELASFLNDDALTARGLGMLILFKGFDEWPVYSPRSLRFVDIPRIGIEVGDRYARLHAHGRLMIEHECRVTIGPMERHWTEYVRSKLAWAPSATVKITLGDTRAINYTLKDDSAIRSVYER